MSRGHTGPIEIAIKFRESQGRLATYVLSVGLDDSNRTVVDREVLRYRRGQHGKPWHFVDFQRGAGAAITNEAAYGHEGVQQEREEYTLASPDVLAIKGLGQFEKFPVVAELRRLIENWRIERLSTHRDDVAQAAQYMHEQHRDRFDRLVARFRDGDFEDPFVSRYVSDGTIKMFAYLILLHDPRPRPLLAVEGPENQLHPDLLRELSEEFRLYTKRGGQVFISTHSPGFLDGVELDEVYWLVKGEGFSVVHAARKSRLLRDLIKNGDSLGALWKQGLLGKRTSPSP